MYSITWGKEVDDWAKWAVCINCNPPDPQSWFLTEKEARDELAEFDEEDQKELIILPVE